MGPFGFRPPQQFQQPMYQQPMYQQPQSQGGIGGFIKNLLGKSQTQNVQGGQFPPYNQGFPFPNQWPQSFPPNMLEQAASTTSSSSGGLLGTLDTVQKGLGVMQQVTPYIKEFSPMLKNLPVVLDMMKMMMESDSSEASSESEDEDKENEEEKSAGEVENKEANESRCTNDDKNENDDKSKELQKRRKKKANKTNELPKPKLYI